MKCVLFFLYLSFFLKSIFLLYSAKGEGVYVFQIIFQYLMLDKPVGIRMIYGPGMDVTW